MPAPHLTRPATTVRRPRPVAVLDTQVVLDWLAFRDPGAAAVGRAIETGRLEWVASAAMRAELNHVLGRGVAAAWHPDRGAIAATWERCALPLEPVAQPASGLRCTDPSDQMFIDLALTAAAGWLFTRDLALLSLAPRALRSGVAVLRPRDWRGDALVPATGR